MDHNKYQEELKRAINTQDLSALEKLTKQMGDDMNSFSNMTMDDHNLPLIVAVALGAKDIVRFLIHHGADINAKGLDETALHVAVNKGDTEMVQLLLLHKPNVNIRCDGFSALYWAAWRGHFDIVSLLLEAKARVDVKTSDRETPLLAAADKGYLNIVKLLVEKGAKVNMICGDGEETALCAASNSDHRDIVQYLLAHGANPNGIGNGTPEDFYAFPLLGACSGAVVELLIAAGAAIHTRNRYGDTALHGLVRRANGKEGAEREKYLEALKMLLAHGADPLAQNQSHVNTPLALSTSPDITTLLQEAIAGKDTLSTGEQATKKNNLGEPMFKMAHNCDKAEQVAALSVLIQQADLDDIRYQSPEDNDATMLHNIINSAPYDHSCRNTPFAPYVEAVALLLQKGANVNAPGGIWKGTPLHIAVKRSSYAGKHAIEEYHHGYIDLIQLLINHQADLSALNRDGCSPLDLATHGPIIDLLKGKGATYCALSDEVVSRIKEGNMAVFEKGMSIELKDKEGNTPLLIAALKNSIPAIEYLLKKGADIQVRNSKWKNNALDIACLACSIEAIRYMVTNTSIELNAVDPISEDTALHYLAAWQPSFHNNDSAGMKKAADETCLWMIQQGAAIDLKNKNGKTATDMARTRKLAAEMLKAARKK